MPCEAHWPFPACSYGGICNETLGKCICASNYIDTGDLWPLSGVDCVVPSLLRDGILFLTIVHSIINFVYRGLELNKARHEMDEFRKHNHNHGHNPFVRIYEFHRMGLILSTSSLFGSIGYWIWRDKIIGKHIPKTLLLAFTGSITCCFVHYASLFFISSIRSTFGQTNSAQGRLFELVQSTGFPVLYVGQIVLVIVLPFGLYRSDDSSAANWSIAFAAVCVQVLVSYLAVVVMTLQGFIMMLRNVIIVNRYRSPHQAVVEKGISDMITRTQRAMFWISLVILLNIMFSIMLCVWEWARALTPLQVVLISSSVTQAEGATRRLGEVVSRNTNRRTKTRLAALRKSIEGFANSRGSLRASNVIYPETKEAKTNDTKGSIVLLTENK